MERKKRSGAQPKRLEMGSPSKRARVTAGHEEISEADESLVALTPVTTPSVKSSKHVVTPASTQKGDLADTPPTARRRLVFGKSEPIDMSDDVRLTYKLVRKVTGAIGGNGSFGAIYGELTAGSMQKMVNLMKEYTELGPTSRFIDVGSGIGKPNLHVIQDPGVEFSYGIEMERSRWVLGLASLKAVLLEARRPNSTLGYKCIFEHGNIMSAKTFDPFTHVYMFSCGFPPILWKHLAGMFNASRSQYLICFHPPKAIIEKYRFEVELITQTPTSMHGSSEGHSGYIYKRRNVIPSAVPVACDEAYLEAYELVKCGLATLCDTVVERVDKELYGGRATRAMNVIHCIESGTDITTPGKC